MERRWFRLKHFVFLFVFAAAFGCRGINYSLIQPYVATWSPTDNGGVNNGTGFQASYPALADFNNQLYLIYAQSGGGFRSASLTGNNFSSFWNLSPTVYSQGPATDVVANPTMTVFGGSLYAAWTEAVGGVTQIESAFLTSPNTWVSANGALTALNNNLTHNASSPTLASLGPSLYALWSEASAAGIPQIRAESYTAGTWSAAFAGGALNYSQNEPATFPQAIAFNNKLYAAWSEPAVPVESLPLLANSNVATAVDPVGGFLYAVYAATSSEISVVRYNGSKWDLVNPVNPVVASASGTPYLCMAVDHRNRIYVGYNAGASSMGVSYYDGTSWTNINPNVADAASDFSMAIDQNNNVYIAYVDIAHGSKATVQKYNPVLGSWTILGGKGFTPNSVAGTSIAVDGVGTPYLAYADSTNNQVGISSWNGLAWVGLTYPTGPISVALATAKPSLAVDAAGNQYVAFIDIGDNVQVWKFNGAWSLVTSYVPGAVLANPSMALDSAGNQYLTFVVGNTVDFAKGPAWTLNAAPSTTIAANTYGNLSVDSLGTMFSPFIDSANQWLLVNNNNGAFNQLSNANVGQIRVEVSNGALPITRLDPGWSFGVNSNSSADATTPFPGIYNGKLYLSWIEQTSPANPTTLARVVVYNGNDGKPSGKFVDGGGLNFNKNINAKGPIVLATYYGSLYATWMEGNMIRVAAYNGNDSSPGWTFADGGSNFNLDSAQLNPSVFGAWPSLVSSNGYFYIGWVDTDGGLNPGTVHVSVGR